MIARIIHVFKVSTIGTEVAILSSVLEAFRESKVAWRFRDCRVARHNFDPRACTPRCCGLRLDENCHPAWDGDQVRLEQSAYRDSYGCEERERRISKLY